MLLEGHRGWRNERKLDPEEGFPRGRYVMLHTLSHILIRELALECGYNAQVSERGSMQKMMESILKRESFFIQQQPILMGPLVDWSV